MKALECEQNREKWVELVYDCIGLAVFKVLWEPEVKKPCKITPDGDHRPSPVIHIHKVSYLQNMEALSSLWATSGLNQVTLKWSPFIVVHRHQKPKSLFKDHYFNDRLIETPFDRNENPFWIFQQQKRTSSRSKWTLSGVCIAIN